MAKKESKRISCKSMHGIQKIMKDTVADLYTPGASSRTLQKKCLNLQKKQSNGFYLAAGVCLQPNREEHAPSPPPATAAPPMIKSRDVQNKGAYGWQVHYCTEDRNNISWKTSELIWFLAFISWRIVQEFVVVSSVKSFLNSKSVKKPYFWVCMECELCNRLSSHARAIFLTEFVPSNGFYSSIHYGPCSDPPFLRRAAGY